jgi:Ca2+-binding RTX toxin-like protein
MLLFVVGVCAVMLTDGSSDEDTESTDRTVVIGGDEDTLVVSNDFIDVIDTVAQSAGAAPDQVESFKEQAVYVSGPIELTTQGGDDLILTSNGDDVIKTGGGDDYVLAAGGNDYVDLGDGDDTISYAGDDRTLNETGLLGAVDAGDDEIYGRKGNDTIVDLLGSNKLSGNEGNDDIVSLDAEGGGVVTPDEVFGGWGQDSLRVDEGDTVTSGHGADRIIVDLDFAGTVEEDYQAVTITDYTPGQDILALTGSLGVFEDIDENTEMAISNLPDGSGSVIQILGIEVVRIEGITNFSRDDIVILGNT